MRIPMKTHYTRQIELIQEKTRAMQNQIENADIQVKFWQGKKIESENSLDRYRQILSRYDNSSSNDDNLAQVAGEYSYSALAREVIRSRPGLPWNADMIFEEISSLTDRFNDKSREYLVTSLYRLFNDGYIDQDADGCWYFWDSPDQFELTPKKLDLIRKIQIFFDERTDTSFLTVNEVETYVKLRETYKRGEIENAFRYLSETGVLAKRKRSYRTQEYAKMK